MNKWKSFSLVLIILIVIVGAACFVCRLLRPDASEIERIFDGTEAVFVEGSGLLSAWRTLGRTDYWNRGTYEGLLDLPPIRQALGTISAADGNWTGRVNPDVVMSAVGDESALGIYMKGASLRLLFVSRVDPNFLLTDRILAIVGADAGISVVSYRGTRVKEAAPDTRLSFLWALDGDLLILSDDREIFYAALDRRIDKTTGAIVSNSDFRRMKRNEKSTRRISGYAVTERLLAIPGARDVVPDVIEALMPESFRFSLSHAHGVAHLDVEATGGLDLFSFLSGDKKEMIRALRDDEIAAAWVGRMPSSIRNTDGQPFSGGALPGLLPYLFPDGFSMFILSDPGGRRQPGMIAVGRRSESFLSTMARLEGESGLTKRHVTDSGTDLIILDNDGAPYLAWTRRDDRIFVSLRPDLLVGKPIEILETDEGLRYNSADGEITLAIRPRRIHGELIRSPGPIEIPFLELSRDEQLRLAAAFYPAEDVAGYMSIAGNKLKIEIDVRLEDTIP